MSVNKFVLILPHNVVLVYCLIEAVATNLVLVKLNNFLMLMVTIVNLKAVKDTTQIRGENVHVNCISQFP